MMITKMTFSKVLLIYKPEIVVKTDTDKKVLSKALIQSFRNLLIKGSNSALHSKMQIQDIKLYLFNI